MILPSPSGFPEQEREARRTWVVPVTGAKGGTGKTALALGLAACLAKSGKRVALVDYDPQGGATVAAGLIRPEDPVRTEAHRVHGFSLYPGGRALANASVQQLAKRLHEAALGHDITLVDLSPALTDACHVSALQKASLVIVVARTDAAGLTNVAEAVQVCHDIGKPIIVVPSLLSNTSLARASEAFLCVQYENDIASVTIPLDARAAEAASVGKPVTLMSLGGRASQATHILACELLRRLENTQ